MLTKAFSCSVLPAGEFAADSHAMHWIHKRLTRDGSDFQMKLLSWISGRDEPGEDDGHLAIVEDRGEIVGWARTAAWTHPSTRRWQTLEAFVSEPYRRRGVASFAAAGLVASSALPACGRVAVFRVRTMEGVARRIGLLPTFFTLDDGKWVRA